MTVNNTDYSLTVCKHIHMREPIILPECKNEKVPEAQHPFYHSVEIQTRFNDFDMLGHLNNSAYLQFMDLAKVRYFEAVTGKPLDMNGIATVIVNINVSFFSPTYFGETISVLTACVKISQRSFVLEQRAVNPCTGDVKCVATVVMAGFDPKTGHGVELDAAWIADLSRFESGV